MVFCAQKLDVSTKSLILGRCFRPFRPVHRKGLPSGTRENDTTLRSFELHGGEIGAFERRIVYGKRARFGRARHAPKG